jgi:uncharacterized protein YxeA
MKNKIYVIIFMAVLVFGSIWFFKKDKYVGFFYPDSNNLNKDIQSEDTFTSLEACRDWVNEQASIYNQNGFGYDYECGKNCDLSGGKPYICEETLE